MKRTRLLLLLVTMVSMLFGNSCSITYKVPNYEDPLLALNKIEVDFSFLDDTTDLYAEAFYFKQSITYTSSPLGFNNEVIFKSFLKESSYYVTQAGVGAIPYEKNFFYLKYNFSTSNDLSFYLFTYLNNRNEISKEKQKRVFYENGNYFIKEGYFLWIGGNALKLKDSYKEYEPGKASYLHYLEFKNEDKFNDFIDFLKDTTFID